MIKALLVAAAAAAALAPSINVNSLIATERAFSKSAAAIGVPASFRKYAAPGGIVFKDKPVPVADAYPGDDKSMKLDWRPALAGAAASGELGFDIGPWTMTGAEGAKQHGWFLTVWGVQFDHKWRFLVDNGVISGPGDSPAPDTSVQIVAPSVSGDASNTFGHLEEAEIGINRAGYGVSSRFLAADAWVLRNGAEAATGSAAAALTKKDPPRITYIPLGGGASGAGDMGYMYGRATWKGGTGHYTRVWVRRGGSWKILIDSLVPVEATTKA